MAKRVEVVNCNLDRIEHYYTGTGGIKKGQFAILDSGTAIDATEGVSTAILLGVAMDDFDAGEVCDIYPVSGSQFKLSIYQGGSTDVFTDANVGTPFDILVDTNDTYIDPNDSTGAFLVLMSYDNTEKTAIVKALAAVAYTA